MRKLASRGIIALGIVATLGLATPVLASAGSGDQSSKGSHQSNTAYLAARHTIDVNFRASVTQAHTTYVTALATATTSSQRSVAHQIYEAAIIQAAATRSSALMALGPEPSSGSGKSGGGQVKSN